VERAGAEGSAGYPSRWEADVVLADGATVHIRPIRPSDAEPVRALHERLSSESVYLRFFTVLPHLSPAMLERFVNVDYVDRMALVAELGDEVIGVARYDRLSGGEVDLRGAEAEVAFTVDDVHQGRGLGTILLEHLAAAAKDNGISRFVADTLPQNRRMLRVFHEAGFDEERTFEDGVVRVVFGIEPTEASIEAMQRRERTAAARSVRRLLSPGTIAVIGASRRPGTIGHQLVHNLVAGGFTGPVYPVNPTAHSVAGIRAYPTVLEVPDDVDLAVIAVPAAAVAAVVEQCGHKHVGGLVVISAGFAERGPAGAVGERALVMSARRNGMRLVGPNCLGIINTDPDVRMNATFSPAPPTPGRIGFVSQSGGLAVVILEEMARLGLGVSTFVSVGNKADISGNDLIHHWDDDPATEVVLLYLESFGNPRTFARVARRLSRQKPIVAVKSGRSPAGWRAARHHSAALPSADRAVDALFRHCGVIRVDTLRELFDVAQVLATQPLPAGRAVAIVGNAGGPAVMTADTCVSAGLRVPELAPLTQQRLLDDLGGRASVTNPVDLPPTTDAAGLRRALELTLADPGVDAAICIFAAPLGAATEAVGDAIAAAAAATPDKPVLACVLGRQVVLRGGPRGLPSFAFPESAAQALGRVADYAEWRSTPEGRVPAYDDLDPGTAASIVSRALARPPAPDATGGHGARWLDDDEVAGLLRAYGIVVAGAPDEAPPGIEVVVEGMVDDHFGPLLALAVAGGSGGEPPACTVPMTDVDAAELVRTATFDTSSDRSAVEQVLLRASALLADRPDVVELHLEPLVVAASGAVAAQARVRVARAPRRPERALRRLR